MTAIDQATSDNGPLIVRPGIDEFLRLDKVHPSELENTVRQKYPNLDQEVVVLSGLEPGDTVFMHPDVLHMSQINQSDVSRIMFINGFSHPGANHKQYPGKGSAQEVDLPITEKLLAETEHYITEIFGIGSAHGVSEQVDLNMLGEASSSSAHVLTESYQ